ncbi:Uncharacterised protein [Vibrio cholerae]|nr:Uncharacterised protein [Vibrio cholerae]
MILRCWRRSSRRRKIRQGLTSNACTTSIPASRIIFSQGLRKKRGLPAESSNSLTLTPRFEA